MICAVIVVVCRLLFVQKNGIMLDSYSNPHVNGFNHSVLGNEKLIVFMLSSRLI